MLFTLRNLRDDFFLMQFRIDYLIFEFITFHSQHLVNQATKMKPLYIF